MSKKNILIIGGGRLLGHYIDSALNKKNNNIYYFNRAQNQQNDLLFSNHIKGDRNIEKDLRKIPSINWDVVIDTCAYNTFQVKLLIDNIPNLNKLIFISSIYIYIIKNNFSLIDEKIKNKIYIENILNYSKEKIDCEDYIINNFKKKFLIVRPGPIIGKFDYSNRINIWKNLTHRNIFKENYTNKEFQIVSANFVASNIINSLNKNIIFLDLPGAKFSYKFFYDYIKNNISLVDNNINYDNNLVPYLLFNELFPGKKEGKRKVLDIIKKL